MKKFRFLALITSVVMASGFVWGCNKKDDAKSESVKNEGVTLADGSKFSELIAPASDSEDVELGSYRLSENDTKLYYEDDVTSPELMQVIEKYFTAIEKRDYNLYIETALPEYIDAYGKYLATKDDTVQNSFELQCDNCAVQVGEGFDLTRIRVEASPEDLSEDYLGILEDLMGEGTAQQIKDASDNIITIVFFVMVDVDGEEKFLAQEGNMVIVEKGGKYYILA